jgi:hypothetical protein
MRMGESKDFIQSINEIENNLGLKIAGPRHSLLFNSLVRSITLLPWTKFGPEHRKQWPLTKTVKQTVVLFH